jgi:hypothetical protein
MSYEWYRAATSNNSASQHPVMRVILDLDGNPATTGDRGGLVFERSYAADTTVPVDTWVADTIGASTNLWNFGLSPLSFAQNIDSTPYAYDGTLAEWKAYPAMANATIVGFSVGIGSGWNGDFAGAADNIRWTIAGVTTSTSFEVPSA